MQTRLLHNIYTWYIAQWHRSCIKERNCLIKYVLSSIKGKENKCGKGPLCLDLFLMFMFEIAGC